MIEIEPNRVRCTVEVEARVRVEAISARHSAAPPRLGGQGQVTTAYGPGRRAFKHRDL